MATATKWKKKIKQACVDAGTYEPFFDSTIETLAKKLEDRDRARKQYEDEGSKPVMEYTNKGGATNLVRNPLLILNKKTDAELIAFLETKNNKAGYIKELIYKDMQETILKKLNG